MSLFDRVKAYFSNTNPDNDPSLVSFDELDSSNVERHPSLSVPPSKTVAAVIPEKVMVIPEKNVILPEKDIFLEDGPTQPTSWVLSSPSPAIEWPAWLEDETLLRDEGVIFGLSSSNADEKVAIIKSYFVHQTASLEREVEQHGEKIQELNLFIEQKENRIGELKEKSGELDNRRADGEHQLPRTIVGLAFSGAMCVGNYFLIADTLQPLYPNSQWIAVGVFLAGMFNLFGRVSLFHDTDSAVSWRKLLEEIGMPLAAALFVFAQAIQNQSVSRSLALLGFVFFLFLFAGKLLLSNITVLRNDLKVWLTKQSLQKEKAHKTENWEEEIQRLQSEINELRIQKWQIVPNLNRAEAELSRLNARRDALIKLFESEFYLARQLRQRLTDKQLREISGE
ncbi:MAG: hypothetical protein R2822_25520 [Spirosomataceae bacterium]